MASNRAVWVGLPAGVLGVAFGAGLIIRDCSLTCNVGYQNVPFAFGAICLLAFPFVALQLRWLGRSDFEGWQVKCALFAAVSFLGFRAWTWDAIRSSPYADSDNPVLAIQVAYLTYYVWVDPLFVLLMTNLVRLVRRVYGEQAERGLGIMAAGVLGGGVVGGLVARLMVPYLMDAHFMAYEIARDHLMVVMALCMLFYAVLALRVAERFPTAEPVAEEEEEEAPPRWSLRKALGVLARDRKLRLTAATLILTGMACIVLDYVFYWVVNDQIDDSNGRTTWFAVFYMCLNGASLLMLVFGTGKLLQRLGLTFALLALPCALLIGGVALLISTTWLVMCCVRIGKDGIIRTLFEPGTECLMMRAAARDYDVLRTVLGGLGFSVGMGLAALLLVGLTFGLQVTLPALIGVLLGLVALWAFTIWRLQRVSAGPERSPGAS